MKKPILKFQTVNEIRGATLKIEAFENYVKIAKQIKHYQKKNFEMFLSEALPVYESTMKMPVLKINNMSTHKRSKMIFIFFSVIISQIIASFSFSLFLR